MGPSRSFLINCSCLTNCLSGAADKSQITPETSSSLTRSIVLRGSVILVMNQPWSLQWRFISMNNDKLLLNKTNGFIDLINLHIDLKIAIPITRESITRYESRCLFLGPEIVLFFSMKKYKYLHMPIHIFWWFCNTKFTRYLQLLYKKFTFSKYSIGRLKDWL